MTYLLGKDFPIVKAFYLQRFFFLPKYNSIHFGENEPVKLTLFWIAAKNWNHHLKAFANVPGTSLHMYF